MTRYNKRLTLAFFSTLLLGLSACSEGPAEDAGESIDEAATDIQNAIEDSCEQAKEQLNTEDQDC